MNDAKAPQTAGSRISRVACVGAGLIGQGWAVVFASRGLEVTLQDLCSSVLDRTMEQIQSRLRFLEDRGFFSQGEADLSIKRIQTTTDLAQAVREAQYVQESVPDRYEVKRRVFALMDEAAPETAILASSSSGLRMSEIQTATRHPERCLLAHPMLPVYLLPVVEVVGGSLTSPETVETTCRFLRELGKEPVRLHREVPGYIVNRLQAAILREAVDLVHRGVASAEDVDRAFCMGIGLRDPFIGPFQRISLAGDGVERFFEHYAESYRYRWESMVTWTSVPPEALEVVIPSVRDMEARRGMSREQIKAWRDEMLVDILKLVERGRPVGDQERPMAGQGGEHGS